ncbi:hypothetical protein ACF3NG_03020 [Aerococcaceae bacterium WGS1372]
MDNPYERLAHAIIIQAVKDYRKACKRLKLSPQSEAANKHFFSCQKFFLSEWFKEITDADGEHLLKKLNEEVGIIDT